MPRSILRLLPILLLPACAPAEGLLPVEGPGPHAVGQNPIVGGTAPDRPEHEAVVALHQLTSDGQSVYVSPFCSGTLIAADVVLTAAHCLDTAGGGPRFRTMDPNQLAIYVGDDPSVDLVANLHLVGETFIHVDYNRRSLRNDLALVRLSAAVSGVTPVPHLPASQALATADVGQPLDFAGFGYDDVTGAPGRGFGVKLHKETPLGGFGCSVYGCPNGGHAATQISYDQRGANGGPCNGDSGGPAFVTRASGVFVAGITSYGDANCATYGVSTRVDAFQGVIDAFAGVAPPPPPPPTCVADGVCDPSCPSGADPDCGLPSSCGDGACGTGESCDGRSGTVACTADCAGVTSGNPRNRYCYVEGACVGAGCP